jgi:hypothetical protein
MTALARISAASKARPCPNCGENAEFARTLGEITPTSLPWQTNGLFVSPLEVLSPLVAARTR